MPLVHSVYSGEHHDLTATVAVFFLGRNFGCGEVTVLYVGREAIRFLYFVNNRSVFAEAGEGVYIVSLRVDVSMDAVRRNIPMVGTASHLWI